MTTTTMNVEQILAANKTAVAEAQAAAETKYVVVSQAVAKTPLVSVAAAPEKKLSFSKRMGRAYRKASGGSMLHSCLPCQLKSLATESRASGGSAQNVESKMRLMFS